MLVNSHQLQMLCLTYLSDSIKNLDNSRQNTWVDFLTAPKLSTNHFNMLRNALHTHTGISVQGALDQLMDNLSLN